MTDNNNTVPAILVTLTITVLGGLIVWSLAETKERNRPPRATTVPNYETWTNDVETTNPASRPYRVTGVRFTIWERLPPPLPVGEIETETIYFRAEDFDAETNSYYKQVHGVEMPANGHLNLRFFILDDRYRDWTFRGRLTIYYDERDNPKPLVIDEFAIIVK